MPFEKGNRANPGGRPKEKEFSDAIRLVCKEETGTQKKKKLRVIAEKVVSAAMKGEPWACNMVADRLEGKPATEATVNLNDGRADINQWSDDELLALLAKRNSANGSDPEESADEPDRIH